MLSSQVIDQTLARFPAYAAGEITVTPLEKGGSGRKFFRVSQAPGHSMILVQYTDQRAENRHYVEIAEYLADSGVRVPRIDFHDSDQGLIWMQDLGEDDLWAHRNAPWEERRPLYEAALREVRILHALELQSPGRAHLQLQMEFDESLYRWEQTYFFENCLGAHFGLDEKAIRRCAELPALAELASALAARPRVFVHRDFQSQNVMIQGAVPWLIDFQGMRPGLAAYDVASLLYDPYVHLTAEERDVLREFYRKECAPADGESRDFDRVFDQCALQRLMQALGAFGFLGHQQGRAEFLNHIPAAGRSLREVAGRIEGLDEMVARWDDLP